MERNLQEKTDDIVENRSSEELTEMEWSEDNEGASSRVDPKEGVPEEEKGSKEDKASNKEGCVQGELPTAESQDNDKTNANSSQESKVNLLEKTRKWKQEQLKSTQLKYLMRYFEKMEGISGRSFNWYSRFGEDVGGYRPERLENLPCECSSVVQILAGHSTACRVRKLSVLFSLRARYFIDEEVDPDLFLYVPLPKEKFCEKAMDYKYNILQEKRKILILKLLQGMRSKLEPFKRDMDDDDVKFYERRNHVRIEMHLFLNNLLENLVRPYYKNHYDTDSDCDDECIDESPTNQEDHKDKREYRTLKETYLYLCKKIKRESFERSHQETIEDAKNQGYYMEYDKFLDHLKESGMISSPPSEESKEDSSEKSSDTDNDNYGPIYSKLIEDDTDGCYFDEYLKFLKTGNIGVSTSEDAEPKKERNEEESEPEQASEESKEICMEESEIEKVHEESEKERCKEESDSEKVSEESKRKRKKSDEETEEPEGEMTSNVEQLTGQPESKRRNSDQEAGEPESKRRNSDQEAGEPESKRRNSDEEAGEPESKRRNSDQEAGEPESKRKNSDQQTGEPESKRRNSDQEAVEPENGEPKSKRQRAGDE